MGQIIKLANPENLNEAIVWCLNTFKSTWLTRHPDCLTGWATASEWYAFNKKSTERIISDRLFYFDNDKDAIMFKLIWG